MSDEKSKLTRRTFIGGVGGAAGAAVLTGAGCGTPTPPGAPTPWDATPKMAGMHTRKLPRGGRVLPILAMGTPPITSAFSALPEEERIGVARHAFERGIRYFDTAFVYNTAPLLGKALADVRDQVYVNTKTGQLDAAKARAEIEEELDRLGFDYVDCAKLHNVGGSAYDTPAEELRDRYLPVVDELEKMKAEGTVRNIGLSSHLNYEVAFKLIDTGRFDELIISRSYFPKGMREIIWPRNMQWRDLAVARAHELGMNIIGMKGLSNVLYGHFRLTDDGSFAVGPKTMVPDYPEDKVARLAGAALRWAFADHRFHLYVVGLSIPADVDEDVALVGGDMALTNDDLLLLADFSTKLWDAPHVKGYATDVHPNYPAPSGAAAEGVTPAALRTRRAEPHLDEV
jgi:predicted aldo/keto reductase-like oxidoreductase